MQTVQVVYHQEPDGWWADSPDVPGYGVAGASLDEVRGLVREGLPFFLEVDQVEVDERFPTAVIRAEITSTFGYEPANTANVLRSKSTIKPTSPPVRFQPAAGSQAA
jgi:predicted RNase H-like HicB family nuclease